MDNSVSRGNRGISKFVKIVIEKQRALQEKLNNWQIKIKKASWKSQVIGKTE